MHWEDSNALSESFWDANGVEIWACANFTDFPGIRDDLLDPKKWQIREQILDWMHWAGGTRCLSSASVAQMLAAASIEVMDDFSCTK